MRRIILSVLAVLFIVGCGNNTEDNKIETKINGTEARQMIAEGAILLDVRTEAEYSDGHIEGATLLSVDNINLNQVEEYVGSKDTVIIVYCRSGNRSSQAVTKLKDLGYINVYDLGSINNW